MPNKRETTHLNLTLTISSNVMLKLNGHNEVHLSGYFEPKHANFAGYAGNLEYGNEDDEDEGGEDE